MKFLSDEMISGLLPAETASFPSPVPTQIVSSDEYLPIAQSEKQREVEARLKEMSGRFAKRQGMSRRRFFQTAINFPNPIERPIRRNNHRDERKLRHAGHRGKIAQGARHRFPPDRHRRAFGCEMNSFHDAIGLEQLQLATLRSRDDRAIVACANDHRAMARKYRQESREQPVFAEISQLHGGFNSGNASAVKVIALKHACIVIGTRMEPLHS